MLNDPFHKTVKLPVKIKNGFVVQLDDQPLPGLRDGAVGDLTLSASDVLDEEALAKLQAGAVVNLLAKGDSVFLGVNPESVPPNRYNELIPPKELGVNSHYSFVEVVLDDELRLRIRGSKTPELVTCKCHIPALRGQEAASLNHALTLISTEFETERISHTGNAFQHGFARVDNAWWSLDDLRLSTQVKHAVGLASDVSDTE